MISIVAVCIDQIVDIMNGNKPGSINIAMGKINNVQYHLFVYTYFTKLTYVRRMGR